MGLLILLRCSAACNGRLRSGTRGTPPLAGAESIALLLPAPALVLKSTLGVPTPAVPPAAPHWSTARVLLFRRDAGSLRPENAGNRACDEAPSAAGAAIGGGAAARQSTRLDCSGHTSNDLLLLMLLL